MALPVLFRARVLRDYAAEDQSEHTIVKDQIVDVVHQHSNGWWVAQIAGTLGNIPSNFVEPLRPDAARHPLPAPVSIEPAAPPSVNRSSKPGVDASPRSRTDPLSPRSAAPHRPAPLRTAPTAPRPVSLTSPISSSTISSSSSTISSSTISSSHPSSHSSSFSSHSSSFSSHSSSFSSLPSTSTSSFSSLPSTSTSSFSSLPSTSTSSLPPTPTSTSSTPVPPPRPAAAVGSTKVSDRLAFFNRVVAEQQQTAGEPSQAPARPATRGRARPVSMILAAGKADDARPRQLPTIPPLSARPSTASPAPVVARASPVSPRSFSSSTSSIPATTAEQRHSDAALPGTPRLVHHAIGSNARPLPKPQPRARSASVSVSSSSAGVVADPPKKELTAEELEKMAKTARAVQAEIVETERSYLAGLLKIGSEYETPLRELKTKLSKKQENWVSRLTASDSIRKIVALSQRLLGQLSGLSSDAGAMARVFIEAQLDFDVYKSYVVVFSEAMDFMGVLVKSKPKIAALLDQARSRCAGLGLDSLMITPIQRIPRYILLFRELLKNLPPAESAARSELERAMRVMQDVADEINEAKRQEEKYQELIVIGGRLLRSPFPADVFVTRRRSFVQTFAGCEWIEPDKQKSFPCQIMVFSDLMLVTDAPDDLDRLNCHSCWFYSDLKLAFPADLLQWGFNAKLYSRLGTAVYIQTPYGIESFLTPSAAARDDLIKHLIAVGVAIRPGDVMPRPIT